VAKNEKTMRKKLYTQIINTLNCAGSSRKQPSDLFRDWIKKDRCTRMKWDEKLREE